MPYNYIDNKLNPIDPDLCIGDTLETFNSNFKALDSAIATSDIPDISTIVQHTSGDWNNAYRQVLLWAANNVTPIEELATPWALLSSQAYILSGTAITPVSGNNYNCGNHSVIAGGCYNNVTSNYSSVLGGCNNNTSFVNTFILGSNLNASKSNVTYVNNLSSAGAVCGNFYGDGSNITNVMGLYMDGTGINAIVPGHNTSTSSGRYSTVINGAENTASGAYSVVYGDMNTASNIHGSILGGASNTASGAYSTVINGSYNTDNGNAFVHILGTRLSATEPYFTYVNNLSSIGVINTRFLDTDDINARNATFRGNVDVTGYLNLYGDMFASNAVVEGILYSAGGSFGGVLSAAAISTDADVDVGGMLSVTDSISSSSSAYFTQPYVELQNTRYIFKPTDSNTTFGSINNTTGLTAIIPNNNFPVGFQVTLLQLSSTNIFVIPADGSKVLLNEVYNNFRTAQQYSAATLLYTGAPGWVMFGDLASYF